MTTFLVAVLQTLSFRATDQIHPKMLCKPESMWEVNLDDYDKPE
jgi:hypothetical protein